MRSACPPETWFSLSNDGPERFTAICCMAAGGRARIGDGAAVPDSVGAVSARGAGAAPTEAPDLAILLAAAYRALTDRLGEAWTTVGIEGMRPSFGFVIRAVDGRASRRSRAWREMLDVTKQSASGLADEAQRAGFVERVAAAGDRRSRHLRLHREGPQASGPPRWPRATSSNASERPLSGRVGSPGCARAYSRS